MAKKTKRRDGGKEGFWRKAIETRERSGLTIRAFCKREGLTESAYQFWRRELIKRGRISQPVRRRRRTRTDGEGAESGPTFASLIVQGGPQDVPGCPCCVAHAWSAREVILNEPRDQR